MNKHALKIIDINYTIEDASAITFSIPLELTADFDFKPGQYLTLCFIINGEEHRRSYSICSGKDNTVNTIQVAVKRVKGGLVSNYINDCLKVGDTVEVLSPNGRFYTDLSSKNYKTYCLFASGSGITPILSILKSVLLHEEHSLVHLLFGNRDQEQIMFYNELEELQEKYKDRLVVVHTLSKPKSEWADVFKSKDEQWYLNGRINRENILWFINEYPPYAQNVNYFICGPGTMIQDVESVLKSIDVPDERIFKESFGSIKSEITSEGVDGALLEANLKGEIFNTSVDKGETLLRALIKIDAEPPYSCEGGICSSCQCKLIEGEVAMKVNLALNEEEVKEGYILSCQSIPKTSKIKVVF